MVIFQVGEWVICAVFRPFSTFFVRSDETAPAAAAGASAEKNAENSQKGVQKSCKITFKRHFFRGMLGRGRTRVFWVCRAACGPVRCSLGGFWVLPARECEKISILFVEDAQKKASILYPMNSG